MVPTVKKDVDVTDIDMTIPDSKPIRDTRTVEWYEFLPLRQQKAEEFKRPLNQMINTRSMKFDPRVYLAKHAIKCQKFHYSVPQFYSDIAAIIQYENEKNVLNIYKLDGKL